ncbi:MAG: 3-oxoacyl-ACP reductase [Halobacteriovoraceae bacterium]|nr:3-oxoacyl-ACP reductase [Halobacteriovoraceae bacterium]|tara:strand:+ start:21010 stop:21756 length:747 start_codon:yes stop_codon:yes gene_type:complete
MNILITGGRSDIAQELVHAYSQQGHTLWVSSSSDEGLEKMKKTYQEKKLSAQFVKFNFKDPSDHTLHSFLGEKNLVVILNSFTRLPPLRKIHEYKSDKIQNEFQQNIFGNTMLVHHILPPMIEQNFGRIILISSVSVENGTTKYPTYVMGKMALEGLMKNIAVDYGENNIMANTVRLGIFNTSRTSKYTQDEKFKEAYQNIIPNGKIGDTSQIPNALMPLMDKNQYINGAVLNISGGLPMTKTQGILK